jgi:D-alanyl-D-alanine carboxypeptidase
MNIWSTRISSACPVPARMRRRDFLKVLAALSCGCGSSLDPVSFPAEGSAGPSSAALQELLEKSWQGFVAGRPNFKGSLVSWVQTPLGTAQASLGEGGSQAGFSRYRIGSCSKLFTASAILLLAQRGRLLLDHTLNDLIPGTNRTYLPTGLSWAIPHRERITLRMLLRHRAGVFDPANQTIPAGLPVPYAGQRWFDYIRTQDPNHTATPAELAAVISETGLSNHLPDAQYRYSNGGYSLLVAVLEQVTGMSFSRFLEEAIFFPLNLRSTRCPFLGTDQRLDPPSLDGYLYQNGSSLDATLDNVSLNLGEGNIISSAADMNEFIRALWSGRLGLDVNSLAQMTEFLPATDYNLEYGLGVSRSPELGWGHDGAHAGYMSTVRFDPKSGVSLVLAVTNLDLANLVSQLEWLTELAHQVKTLAQGQVGQVPTVDLPGIEIADALR